MLDLVPLCGEIYIWSSCRKIGVTITPQKKASPLIRMSDQDGRIIQGLDDLTSDRIGSESSLTNWLLKRQLHKAVINWKVLCSISPLCVDVVNQIAQQLEHIVLQTARCVVLEESARLDRLKWNLMHPSTPAVASRELMLARLERIWLITDKGFAALLRSYRNMDHIGRFASWCALLSKFVT